MNRERWQLVKDALNHALELEGDARLAYVAEVSADDRELRLELDSLIAAHEDSAESFLNVPAAAMRPVAETDALRAGAMIGNYRLVRKLGDGGMGQVWLAEQTAPVRRRVAVKLIRAGMYDEAVLQRFQVERQSLALMDHPAIAKVFDAGSTPQGYPYLVMEYVPGLPITEYCDQKKLPIRARLALFIQACEGVQHAHQKAIIHRDLKPANILIVEVDGKAVPRIIDFGLAKPTIARIAGGESLHTQLGQFIGTPGYMSPEQVDAEVHDVDTRTDVYSLGVVLYVLLTGFRPFESKGRAHPSLDEWIRQLREEEPPSLATKLTSDRQTAAAVAAARSDEPQKLIRALRGDLDWIATRALERDRERRYSTPSDLSADLRRYLDNEPVAARPASGRAYRIQKFAQRHRVGIALSIVLILGLAGGLAATTYEARVAAEERDAALQAQLRSLTQTAAARLREGDVPAAMGIILEVLPHRSVKRAVLPEALSVFQEARASDAQLAAITGHQDSVLSAAFSPDGTRVVTSSDDKTARIWDIATGRQIALLSGHAGRVNCAAFSPDGARVVTASHDHTARIWDAATGRQIVVLSGHTDRVWTAAFSPDGKRIVTASRDQTARIWDAATGRQIMALVGHADSVHSAVFSPDGRLIATASYDKSARVWDAATGRQIVQLSGHTDLVLSAAFSPDGRHIVTASIDNTARTWNLASGQQELLLGGHTNWLASAAFSPDGGRIVTASYDGTARIWDAATARQILLLSGHSNWLSSASFSADGRRVITASYDKTARIWDVEPARQISMLAGHGSFVGCVVFSADGLRMATASNDRTVRIWDAATLQPLETLSGHSDMVNSVAFSPDGRQVVTASNDRTARIWDVATGQPIQVLAGHTQSVNTAAFSPDGRRVVTASVDRTARIWDAASGRQLRVLDGHRDDVRNAAFSPDGRRVLTASWDKTARIWDAASGQPILELNGHTDRVSFATFSPDGTRVLTTSKDWTARIWDAATGQQILVLSGHSSIVESGAFSPDGTRVATASDDKTARIWDARVAPLDVQTEWAEAALFDPLSVAERYQLGLPAPIRSRRLAGTPCDDAAAAPYDPDRRAPGVMLARMAGDMAVAACSAGASGPGGNMRSAYELGRSFMASGKFLLAKQSLEAALAAGYRSAAVDLGLLLTDPAAGSLDPARAVSLYEQAWQAGVTIAGFRLGRLYEAGLRSNESPARIVFAPDAGRAWGWYRQAAARGEPNALARFAERAQSDALAATDTAQKNRHLLQAFRLYAAAAEHARVESWPDDAWKAWRYERASLARLLAEQGMMQQAADAYAAAIQLPAVFDREAAFER